ncbi:hypothetical protein N2152v2_005164 [Parachlorella kessleri]
MDKPGQTTATLYPVHSYTFGSKPPKFEKDTSVAQRMERLKEKYLSEGVRRTVDGVLIAHEHNHPHILLVQVGSSFFKLPGGRLRPGEDEVEGLMRKLNNLLAPAAATFRPNWRVGECLATYYRPNFENTVYPYCPAHVTRPKEVKKVFHIVLPDRGFFSVPKNMRLVAVPLFEIYDNPQRYGPIIASIPQLVSRFQFILAGGKAAGLPAAQVQQPQLYQPPQPQQSSVQQAQPAAQQQQQMAIAQQQQQQQRGAITVSFQQQPQAMNGAAQQPMAAAGMQSMPSGGAAHYQQQQQAADDFMVDFDD